MNKGVLLKDAAKQLSITYHEAKIAHNEHRRKLVSASSETESTVYTVRSAGVSALKVFPRRFLL